MAFSKGNLEHPSNAIVYMLINGQISQKSIQVYKCIKEYLRCANAYFIIKTMVGVMNFNGRNKCTGVHQTSE